MLADPLVHLSPSCCRDEARARAGVGKVLKKSSIPSQTTSLMKMSRRQQQHCRSCPMPMQTLLCLPSLLHWAAPMAWSPGCVPVCKTSMCLVLLASGPGLLSAAFGEDEQALNLQGEGILCSAGEVRMLGS